MGGGIGIFSIFLLLRGILILNRQKLCMLAKINIKIYDMIDDIVLQRVLDFMWRLWLSG